METAVQVPSIHMDVSSKRAGVFQRTTCRSANTTERPKTLKPANNSSKANPLVRRLLHREEPASNQNRPPVSKGGAHGKRRQSFSALSEHKHPFKRRRRGDLFTPPTKFLLGGNINDPLNLASFADDEVNKKANEVTPKSSPIPTPKHRTQVEVLIPPNINDPLNLNSGEDIEFSLISPRNKKRRRRSKRKSMSEGDGDQGVQSAPESCSGTTTSRDEGGEPPCAATTNTAATSTPRKLSGSSAPSSCSSLSASSSSKEEKVVDKIVSPVVPQGSPVKNSKRKFSTTGSASRDVRRTHQHARRPKQVYFRAKDAHFQYGNYNRYYGYRNNGGQEDPRLKAMRAAWFDGKDVLDIGCNVGHFTLSLARDFKPRKVIGIDIDGGLIQAARSNVRHYLTAALAGEMRFPVSMAICHGPIAAAALPGKERQPVAFPNNIFFVEGNYILDSDVLLESQREEFDTIMCLSLTKWVHLNWGDVGIQRLFKRMFRQLRPGGRMILEAQPFSSYAKKKKMTETSYKHYHNIRLRPEKFNEYLLSPEVGFASYELIDTPSHASKGFQRPLYLFTKAGTKQESSTEAGCSVSSAVEMGKCKQDAME